MVKDFSRYAIFTFFNIVIGYTLLWFVANQLTKEDYAQYGWYTTIFAIAVVFYNVGHRDALFKLASQRSLFLGKAVSTALLCVFTAFLILIPISFFFPLLFVSGIAFLLLHLVNVVSAVNRGLGAYQKDAIAMPIYRIGWLFGCVLVMCSSGKLSIEQVFYLAALSALLTLIAIGGISIIRQYFTTTHLVSPLANTTIRHFFLIELVTTSFIKIDLPLLKFYGTDDVAVSDYFLAFQMFEAGILFLAPVSFLLFNRFNSQSNSTTRLFTLFKAGVLVLILVGMGNIGWWLFGNWFLQLLFPKYVSAYELISLFLLILLPNAFNMLLGHVLYSVHQEKIFIGIVASGLGVLLLANVWLDFELLTHNVIYSRLIAESYICLLLLFTTYKYRHKLFNS